MPCCGGKSSVGSATFSSNALAGAIGSTIGFGAAVGAGVSLSSIMNPMLAIPGLCGLIVPALFPWAAGFTAGNVQMFLSKMLGGSFAWLYSDLGAVTAALGAAGVVYYVSGSSLAMGIGALGASLGWIIGVTAWTSYG